MNIARHLEQASRRFPDADAILFEEQRLSYRELERAASRCANALRGLGVGRGARVALLLPNVPEFVVAYHGIQKIGAIAVSLNTMLKSREVAFILNDAGVMAIITTTALRGMVDSAAIPGLRHVIITAGDAAHGEHALAALASRARSVCPAAEMQRDDPAALLYTSGTTGFPKGATLSHGNIGSNVQATVRNCGMRAADRLLLFLPLFHCFGQNFIMNAALAAGATLVMQRRFSADETLELIARQRVTMFFGVPTNFIVYLNAEIEPARLQSVRYYFTAAAKMPASVAAAWAERFGQKIHEGYGLTETSPMASYNHVRRHKHGAIGTPIEKVEMKIVDAEGQPLAAGIWGEIVIRGPNVMSGYWGRPVETARAIRDGWFHSGDIGTLDDEGYFYICDRLDDMVITSGYNVYPAEVENVLYAHPAIAEAAVYGVPDAVKGEVVKATVVTRTASGVPAAALIDYCRERLANYKVPRVIEFATGLPRNPAGKVLKRLLRNPAAPE